MYSRHFSLPESAPRPGAVLGEYLASEIHVAMWENAMRRQVGQFVDARRARD